MADDRRLLFLLHRASRAALGRANAVAAERLGVSAPQLGTLAHLAKHPGSTVTEIAALFDLNKSAVSTMITRLERAGLVRRAKNPDDARGALLFLTADGERARQGARPVVRRLMGEMTEGFTEHEMAIVWRFLNALVDRYAAPTGEEREP